MIEKIEVKQESRDKYLLIVYLEGTDITHGIYLTKKELYLFYTKVRGF